jgi:hypothetical protein
MIGDTPYDIESAHRAGVKTIALRCGGFWTDQDFYHAIAIYDSPHDLLERIQSSPLLQNRAFPRKSPVLSHGKKHAFRVRAQLKNSRTSEPSENAHGSELTRIEPGKSVA